jgi:hypothetical protein
MAALRILSIRPVDPFRPYKGALVVFRICGMPRNIAGELESHKLLRRYKNFLTNYQTRRLTKYWPSGVVCTDPIVRRLPSPSVYRRWL